MILGPTVFELLQLIFKTIFSQPYCIYTTDPNVDTGRLGGGVVAGIVIVLLLVVALCVAVVIVLGIIWWRKRSGEEEKFLVKYVHCCILLQNSHQISHNTVDWSIEIFIC